MILRHLVRRKRGAGKYRLAGALRLADPLATRVIEVGAIIVNPLHYNTIGGNSGWVSRLDERRFPCAVGAQQLWGSKKVRGRTCPLTLWGE
ncbi:hypothetical protein NJB14197_38630 [Mycobacterium montefiorense]|uniref:Uncharacterized protein n=1 Tax=Mycobacterium montefiorense TaxID=154654 RepID=A0AA37PPT7_9MYCO|nr:hypothetical protein MmonteBS_39890 [Mycobacterium montefiorense]GKU35488.1 hypothetical protein NJB14191_28340 [Mycobacterium montefiorense]GKU40493.1 hypothetical protein NJB14192_24800 [Mycobacterium montefiorense]GKU44996.1 hypothetical protein NJB14194_16200 [Mycobacterium montefiorense]GKU51146.1 hypothetical protein NJB14195_23920 [Mycobacterium montefiorense]